MSDKIPSLGFLETLAARAANIMQGLFPRPGKEVETWVKDDDTPVTRADKEISKFIKDSLERHYPEVAVCCEEGGVSGPKDARCRVIVDPVDGTSAYRNGLPAVFAIAITWDGVLHRSVICSPLLYGSVSMYTAERTYEENGKMVVRSRLNGRDIHVAPTENVTRYPSIGIATWPGDIIRQPVQNMHLISHDLQQMGFSIQGVSTISLTTALVSSGSIVAALFPGKTAHDIGPGHLLVEGAGGMVTDLRGKALSYNNGDVLDGAVFSNGPELHELLLKVIGEHYK